MKWKHHNHSASFMAKVAVAAICGDKTMAELSGQFDVHQNQVTDWRRKLLESLKPTECSPASPRKTQQPFLYVSPKWTDPRHQSPHDWECATHRSVQHHMV